jgi:hypothetical protein
MVMFKCEGEPLPESKRAPLVLGFKQCQFALLGASIKRELSVTLTSVD